MNRELLVVDDDPVIRLMLKTHLDSRGYLCALAGDGVEALRLLESGRIQVLVTDLDMPGMGGLELLAAVRNRGLLTRCVVVTGYATIANLTACLREGAVALVPKPLDDLTLLDQAVAEAFAQMQRWAAQMGAIVRMRPAPVGQTPTDPLEPRNGHAR